MSSPSTPPGPTRPFTSVDVTALSCQPSRAWSLSTSSSLSPDILPPTRPSRSPTPLYGWRAATAAPRLFTDVCGRAWHPVGGAGAGPGLVGLGICAGEHRSARRRARRRPRAAPRAVGLVLLRLGDVGLQHLGDDRLPGALPDRGRRGRRRRRRPAVVPRPVHPARQLVLLRAVVLGARPGPGPAGHRGGGRPQRPQAPAARRLRRRRRAGHDRAVLRRRRLLAAGRAAVRRRQRELRRGHRRLLLVAARLGRA